MRSSFSQYFYQIFVASRKSGGRLAACCFVVSGCWVIDSFCQGAGTFLSCADDFTDNGFDVHRLFFLALGGLGFACLLMCCWGFWACLSLRKGGGVAYLLGPTGGYILGFLPAMLLFVRVRGSAVRSLLVLLGGVGVIYVCGLAWLGSSIGWDKSLLTLLASGVVSFCWGGCG